MRALITGISGQDGAYLSRFLLDKGYEVHGIKRRSSSFNTQRLDDIFDRLHLHYGDMTDSLSVVKIINKVKPDEIYHLGAMSHVKVSFDVPEYCLEVALGFLRIIEAVQFLGLDCKIYNACSSEMFGNSPAPQNEKTKFDPRSPYAVSKVMSYYYGQNYRDFGMKISNGILFNHESPMRGETFVTRKITEAVKKIVKREQKCLYLGNLDAKRDWGHAKDYVRAMWLMLQVEPNDYVIATGESHTVREFCTLAFKEVGINLDFRGGGVNETGINLENNEILVRVDEKYFRPTEVDFLQGDSSKARKELGWKPEISFEELIKEMINQ